MTASSTPTPSNPATDAHLQADGLLPCPFCGLHPQSNTHFAWCDGMDDERTIHHGVYRIGKDAWNTRSGFVDVRQIPSECGFRAAAHWNTRTAQPQEAPAPVRAVDTCPCGEDSMTCAEKACTRRVASGEEPTWDELHSVFKELYHDARYRIGKTGDCCLGREHDDATLYALQAVVSRVVQCERGRPPTRAQAASAGEPVAWRSRYTMEAEYLSDWRYFDKFVPVASPSTGYEVQALYTTPTPVPKDSTPDYDAEGAVKQPEPVRGRG